MNLWRLFDGVARAVPARECVVWRGRRLTYAQVHDRACRLANVFAAAGLGARRPRAGLEPWESGQDLVGCYLLNGPEYLEATLAGYAARVAPFNVNHRYVADELAYLLDDAAAGAVVYHERFTPVLAEALARLGRRPLLVRVADGSGHAPLDGGLDYEDAIAGASPVPPDLAHDPDDLYVLYTGGTTGMPKGTLWRQDDIWEAALAAGTFPEGATVADVVPAAAGKDPPPSFLPNAPFMHGAAHWLALRAVLTGERVVINSVVDRLDPDDVWSLVERERVTSMLLVGEAFARPLLDRFEASPVDVSSLRLFVVGGAVTSPATKARILRAVPHALVLDAAGSSETGSALAQVATAGTRVEGGVFSALPSVAVLDEARSRLLRPGEDAIGWFAKSGRIPLGYLGDPERTARSFPVVDGRRWSVPGDRARWRPDGTVELLGRDAATINTGGEKVFAEEVEAALLDHPDVRDVVVVGRPSERWGEEVVAVVALRPGAVVTDDVLRAAVGARLARYKVPKAFVRVDEVRRGPAGKVDYRWARARAGDPR
ncbi:MAG: acyl-CoA synthetase [Acidimicrobiia bacterium]|nr:MAG: acyl-CoA synthetase [Acidimicrobiia bacterium]